MRTDLFWRVANFSVFDITGDQMKDDNHKDEHDYSALGAVKKKDDLFLF